jgi:peptidoglycan/LPS O-acetylase OafA/YrhL
MSAQPENPQPDKLTIGVLYGFRALMVLFVCNFHIWQQGWMGQYVYLFGTRISFDFWTRSGYLFVDGMLLMSGFLLYLPYARQKEYGTPVPSVKRFYWNRLVRIVPSYLAAVLIMLFFYALPSGAYSDAAARNKDILTHLTFTFTFFRDTYLYTPLDAVLWTVGIEMQFYLVFPLLAAAARKKPAATLSAMVAAGLIFRLIVSKSVSSLSMWLNQFPAFLDVYALGMLGATAYMALRRRLDKARRSVNALTALAATAAFAGGCWALVTLVHTQTDNALQGYEQLRQSQWMLRFPLACTMLLLMLSAAFLPRLLQKLLDNRLMRFLATISFNLYIWHQVLSVRIAQDLFPDTLHSDSQLQLIYTLLCYALSILVAMAATYGLEKPAASALNKTRKKYLQYKETKKHEGSPGTETM